MSDAELRIKYKKASPKALEHVHARGNRAVFMRISVSQGCVDMIIGVLAGQVCRIAGGLC